MSDSTIITHTTNLAYTKGICVSSMNAIGYSAWMLQFRLIVMASTTKDITSRNPYAKIPGTLPPTLSNVMPSISEWYLALGIHPKIPHPYMIEIIASRYSVRTRHSDVNSSSGGWESVEVLLHACEASLMLQ
ncbi:hypothetical protein PC116_g13098 [Phytophthora cactorum]|uniref:Uncharacterized protein n=1 Tax=Phytophthora cactorum TaxID=29920 RepID=A0A8T1CPC2_9STRA|nr:hypothetical protein Pcac1_g18379 [Phytophthora cactorum]KAG2908589.1 hypothetical protein PC114_g10436 [Phytophthora cactorum]KAG2925732.1 hypothetical protein PC117_g15125 [Phytophthora cactorum]KAG3005397.1 hypothetical protein PC119_g15325 [Phytophthora cactorum]KAG3018117.1 hypothetical protein PC120_g10610 [Phytophthora cactorum]